MMRHHLTEEQHACWRRIGFVSVAEAVRPDEAGTGVAALLAWAADEIEP